MDNKKYVVDEDEIRNEKNIEVKNHRNKLIIIASIVCIIFVVIIINVISTNKTNELAKKQLAELKCDEALKNYEKIGKSSKTENEIKECKYNLANKYIKNTEYEKAYKIFVELNDYKDSHNKYLEAYYKYAEDYEKNEKYFDAALIYNELSGYEDSEKKYLELENKILNNSQAGDYVLFGKYEQDGIKENGEEPIEWLVLNKKGDNILLISKYILNKMRFGTSYLWEKSEIRDWLNSDFYNNSFNKDEQSRIQKMITSDQTDDNIFCLSAEEARTFFANNKDRVAYPTKVLIDNGFKTWSSENKSGEWWTRSVSRASNGKGVVPVEGDGNVRSAGTNELAPAEYTYTDIGARPVISLNMDSISDTPLNMEIYGHDSNMGLDNEPTISSNNSSSDSSNKRACYGGSVGCRSGFHPCHQMSNGYCNQCCKNN